MRLDRLRLPKIWKCVHLTIPIVVIAIWSNDFEFASADFQLVDRNGFWRERLEFQFVGVCIGGFLGLQFQLLSKDGNTGLIFGMMLIGITSGLAATLSIGVMYLIVFGILSLSQRPRILVQNPLFALLIIFLFQVVAWNFLDGLSYWPNNSANSWILIAYLLPGTLATTLRHKGQA